MAKRIIQWKQLNALHAFTSKTNMLDRKKEVKKKHKKFCYPISKNNYAVCKDFDNSFHHENIKNFLLMFH